MHRAFSSFVPAHTRRIALLSVDFEAIEDFGDFSCIIGDLTKDTPRLRVGPLADTGSNVQTRAMG